MNFAALLSTRDIIAIIIAAVVISAAVIWSLVRARRHQNFLFAEDEAFAGLTKAQQKNVVRLYTGLMAFEKISLAANRAAIEMNLKYVFHKYHMEVASDAYGKYRAISYEYHGLIELVENDVDHAREWFEKALAAREDGALFTETARKFMKLPLGV